MVDPRWTESSTATAKVGGRPASGQEHHRITTEDAVTPRTQLLLAIVALFVFTGLVITMLCLGEPANAIASLILAIVLGVTQLLQALAGPARGRGSHRPTPLAPAESPTPGLESAAPDDTDKATGDADGTAAADQSERPAA
jgi:hypothetical protein